MSLHKITNIPASIRDKLLNKSRINKRPFIEILQYYSMERLLYRLSISKHVDKFFLKGALMFRIWQINDHRPTMDIDLLGKTLNTPQNLANIFREICEEPMSFDDGLRFLSNTVRGKVIQNDAEYEGIRIEFEGNLNKAIVNMQVDIGFGDIIIPGPELLAYPTILDLPAPQIQGYTIESVIAEKLEAMVKRGISNSRMKDFFDIWTILRRFTINNKTLVAATQATFHQRGTKLYPSAVCFSEDFAIHPMKNAEWRSFIHKNQLLLVPDTFAEVMHDIHKFLFPILEWK